MMDQGGAHPRLVGLAHEKIDLVSVGVLGLVETLAVLPWE